MPDEDHDAHDGCLCGQHPLADHEVTEDHELPAAKGGVVSDLRPRRRKPTKTAVED